jgi:hypothetical protein
MYTIILTDGETGEETEVEFDDLGSALLHLSTHGGPKIMWQLVFKGYSFSGMRSDDLRLTIEGMCCADPGAHAPYCPHNEDPHATSCDICG